MRRERQIEFIQQVADSGPGLVGLLGPSSSVQPSYVYTDPKHFGQEQRLLFRNGPTYMGLSVQCTEPGSYLSATFGGVPVAVMRQDDGSLRGFVNVCRHRGAPLLGSSGSGQRKIQCGYHNWTYELDGRLHSRPLSDNAFDDVTLNCDLHEVAVAEKYGMIFVRAQGGEPIDVDAALGGAQDDLGSFGLDHYVHIESRSTTWNMNWKLFFDTFTESYHIRTLHKTTLAPTFHSGSTIFEAFGHNLLSIGLRKDVRDELQKPKDEWSIIPYGTIQYFLLPSGLVVHQLDHIEAWRVEPIDVHTTRVVTSIFAPEAPKSEGSRGYFVKNLDLLLQVTGTEDFPLMEGIQANLDSGALPAVVYGRIEYPLVYLHQSLDNMLQQRRESATAGANA